VGTYFNCSGGRGCREMRWNCCSATIFSLEELIVRLVKIVF
jgi:hypothetical protein